MTGSKEALRRFARTTHSPVDERQVTELILAHPWVQDAACIMAYCAIPPEIDLSGVLQAILAQGKKLLLPRCEADGSMTARKIDSMEELMPGAYGILEPGVEAACVAPEEIDLVLVPGLAFDEKGGRLGRGKGYYDRFLSSVTGKTMGICSCLVPEVPMEPHDKRMDAVVTEKSIMICEMEDSPC